MDAAARTTRGRAADGAAIESGAVAGLAGLGVFLTLHQVWIVPIWSIAPVGAVIAAAAGAAVGAACDAVAVRGLPRPVRALAILTGSAFVLAPSLILGELRGPLFRIGPDGRGVPLVSATDALTAFGIHLASATAMGALLGALLGRTRRASASMALAGLAIALGPGHNIPMLGGTPATATQLAILGAAFTVASVVLVELGASRASPP